MSAAPGGDASIGIAPVHVLVIPNETVGGAKLLDAIKQRAAAGPIRCTVVCPQNQPERGFVVYDESARTAARIRLDWTIERLRELGIPASGELGDPDPFLAAQDAVREHRPDEVIISTLPYPRSGFLRRDLVERIRSWSKLPVEHVVVDLRGEPVRHVLVVANETIGGRELIDSLEKRASGSPHRFTVIAPKGGKDPEAAAKTQERLDEALKELRQAGLDVVGQVLPDDPYTSIMNAQQFHSADEIVISTFPGATSNWLRGDLINRVRRGTGKPVEHFVMEPAQAQREPAGVTS